MKISIIAAIGKNRELGKDNKLLWHIPEDMQRFKMLTSGHVVVMGRKTFESIGRPLPNRKNIIITRDRAYKAGSCIVVSSLEEALQKGKEMDKEEIFIIGGSQIYTQALLLTQKLYLTIVDSTRLDADTYFPEYYRFHLTKKEDKKSPDGLSYSFCEFEL